MDKLHIVMGGFHLAPPEISERINPTIKDISELNPDYVITGHCTGAKAQYELTSHFIDRHIPYGVGTVFSFD